MTEEQSDRTSIAFIDTDGNRVEVINFTGEHIAVSLWGNTTWLRSKGLVPRISEDGKKIVNLDVLDQFRSGTGVNWAVVSADIVRRLRRSGRDNRLINPMTGKAPQLIKNVGSSAYLYKHGVHEVRLLDDDSVEGYLREADHATTDPVVVAPAVKGF